jgi:hypothetical protein
MQSSEKLQVPFEAQLLPGDGISKPNRVTSKKSLRIKIHGINKNCSVTRSSTVF